MSAGRRSWHEDTVPLPSSAHRPSCCGLPGPRQSSVFKPCLFTSSFSSAKHIQTVPVKKTNNSLPDAHFQSRTLSSHPTPSLSITSSCPTPSGISFSVPPNPTDTWELILLYLPPFPTCKEETAFVDNAQCYLGYTKTGTLQNCSRKWKQPVS